MIVFPWDSPGGAAVLIDVNDSETAMFALDSLVCFQHEVDD